MNDGIDDVGRATLAREAYFRQKAIDEEQRLHGDEAHVPPTELEKYHADRAAKVAAQATPVVAPVTDAPAADTMHAPRRQPVDRVTTTLGTVEK